MYRIECTQSPIRFSILTHARYEYAEFILSQYNLETAAIESHSHFPFYFLVQFRAGDSIDEQLIE